MVGSGGPIRLGRDGSVLAFLLLPFAARQGGSEKSGNTPGVDAAEPSRCLQGSRFGRMPRWTAASASNTARMRRGRRPGDIAAAHPLASRWIAMLPETHGAFPGVGLRPWFQIYSLVWSGNRTRDSRFTRPMLYPTELSSGGRTGFEPVANGMRRCSTSELSSARANTVPGPRHTPRQCRAHRVGDETHAAVDRSRYLRIGASSKAPIRVLLHPSPPAPKHQGAARPCACAAFPASGQQCPDASGARCNRV